MQLRTLPTSLSDAPPPRTLYPRRELPLEGPLYHGLPLPHREPTVTPRDLPPDYATVCKDLPNYSDLRADQLARNIDERGISNVGFVVDEAGHI